MRTRIKTEGLRIFTQLLELLAGRGGETEHVSPLLATSLLCCGGLFMADCMQIYWQHTACCYGWRVLLCTTYRQNTDRQVSVGLQWSFLSKRLGLERPTIIRLAKNAFLPETLQSQVQTGNQSSNLKGLLVVSTKHFLIFMNLTKISCQFMQMDKDKDNILFY